MSRLPVSREVLDEELARVNAARGDHERVILVSFEPRRFVLSYPNRAMPEGQCLDQDFTDIQFALHERHRIDTGIQGGRYDEAQDRYHVAYETVEWD